MLEVDGVVVETQLDPEEILIEVLEIGAIWSGALV